ncbi:MAG: hypothetical protein ACREKS_22705, partial [Candidatus Rokuibacteriota bacterium]
LVSADVITTIRYVYLLGAISVVALGLTWMVYNASVIPSYGDTIDYLGRARTLHVDQYRTILYPAFLRLGGAVRHGVGQPSTAVIYAVQWSALAASTGLFTAALANGLGVLRWGRRPSAALVLATVALVATNPLAAHFAFSLMSDSLATSLTMAFVGSLAFAIGGAPSPPRRRLWLGIALVCFFLMALSRVEKFYGGVVLASITGVWLVRNHVRLGGPFALRRAAVVLALLAGTLGVATIVNRVTQTHDPGQAPLDLSSMAFNRVVWPRLARVHPHLSPEARAQIPFDEAVRFDAHNNNADRLLTALLTRNRDNQRIIDEITLTTFQTFPLAVIGKTMYDFAKYTFPNIAFPLERASILPESGATRWTFSRMGMARPGFTRVVLFWAEAFFLIVQLPLAAAIVIARRERALWTHPVFWLTVAAILSNALLFGLASGMDAHIRYALPAYVMSHASVTLLSLLWLIPRTFPRAVRAISDP